MGTKISERGNRRDQQVTGATVGLDAQQMAAVHAPRGPVCILAGAGTGKTRTITHRISYLIDCGQVRADQVLAVTFTARAAGELRERLAQLGSTHSETGSVQARTFHAAAIRQLSYFWPKVYGDKPWQLLDNKFRAVAQSARQAGVQTSTETVRDVLSEIDWAKSTLISPEQYQHEASVRGRSTPIPAAKIAEVFRAYEDAKVSGPTTLLDFDDLLSFTALALEESPEVAQTFRDRYRCFVVDEFQDVNPSQYRLLSAWLGGRDDLTVVGDANQTIYSFAGADPRYLLDFSRRFDGAKVVRLESDYRSTPQIVDLANRTIVGGSARFAATSLTLRGMQPAGSAPVIREYPNDDAEAAGVADRIAALIAQGTALAEIAVLYRINSQSERIEQALTDRGIAFRIKGGEGFYERPEIRSALAALHRAASTAEEDSGITVDTGELLLNRVSALLHPLGLTDAEPAGAQAREKWQSLRTLVDVVNTLVETQPSMTLAPVVAELRSRAADRHVPAQEGVTLASLHAAKGLEWDAVFLIGVHEGSMPISHAIRAGDDAVDEERRLLYVGITRSRFNLQISWSRSKNPGGKSGRSLSRFIEAILPNSEKKNSGPASARGSRPGTTGGGAADLCRVCGQALDKSERRAGRCADCLAPGDAKLFEALRSWRNAAAEENGAPPFTVVTNATLDAIAQARPLDEEALGRIPGIGPSKLGRYGANIVAVVTKNQR